MVFIIINFTTSDSHLPTLAPTIPDIYSWHTLTRPTFIPDDRNLCDLMDQTEQVLKYKYYQNSNSLYVRHTLD
jgi:hypothetical protein